MEHEQKMRTLCENLRLLRKKHGLSKVKMAKILGIGVRMLTNLEQGVVSRRLGGSMLYNAGEYFGVRADDLFRPMGNKESSN